MWHHIALDIKRSGKLIGHMTFTVDVPELQGIVPVGIDLNETNALVAVDPEGHILFVSGIEQNALSTQLSIERDLYSSSLVNFP